MSKDVAIAKAGQGWTVWRQDSKGNLLVLQRGLDRSQAEAVAASLPEPAPGERHWLSHSRSGEMVFRSASAPRYSTFWPVGAAALFCGLQTLGIAVTIVVAAMEIESIIVSGPVMSLIGLAVAFGWRKSRSLATLAFGLSPGILSLFTFALINGMEWGPGEARQPVMLMLFAYEILFVPLGLAVLYGILTNADPRSGRPRQFSLRTLLLVTSLVAFAAAASRIALTLHLSVLAAIALGFFAGSVIATLIFAWLGMRHADVERLGFNSPRTASIP